jgi:hypothetical protein
MAKSIFSRFLKPRKEAVATPTLDISRVMGGQEKQVRQTLDAERERPKVDLAEWKQKDLDRLADAWSQVCDTSGSDEAKSNFAAAIHDLHGASGAYGGGALTRVTGSLQRLTIGSDDLMADAALINLHVQATRAAGMGKAADEIADAVCDALEVQVESRLEN